MKENLLNELRDFYDEEGQKDYQASLYKAEDWVHNRLKNMVISYSKQLCRQPHTMLDAGCAEGLYLREMSSSGAQAFGIDISIPKIKRGLKYAQGFHDVNLLVAMLGAMPFQSESFDLVLSIETLEHVPDLDKALWEIHRVIRSGGWLICSVPTEQDEYLGSWKQQRTWREKSGHLHSFSQQGFKKLLENKGFIVKKKIAIDVLGPQVRHRITTSLPWMWLKRGHFLLRGKMGQKSKISLGEHNGKTIAKASSQYISLVWWHKLDKLLSIIPLVNARASYCIYITVKEP
jgi:2-polyprenyl-3-methyl-5-hydroxy-6-metoxy-1,4-benzoquinol methylase